MPKPFDDQSFPGSGPDCNTTYEMGVLGRTYMREDVKSLKQSIQWLDFMHMSSGAISSPSLNDRRNRLVYNLVKSAECLQKWEKLVEDMDLIFAVEEEHRVIREERRKQYEATRVDEEDEDEEDEDDEDDTSYERPDWCSTLEYGYKVRAELRVEVRSVRQNLEWSVFWQKSCGSTPSPAQLQDEKHLAYRLKKAEEALKEWEELVAKKEEERSQSKS